MIVVVEMCKWRCAGRDKEVEMRRWGRRGGGGVKDAFSVTMKGLPPCTNLLVSPH